MGVYDKIAINPPWGLLITLLSLTPLPLRGVYEQTLPIYYNFSIPPFKLSTSKFLSSFNSDFRNKSLETKKMIENICKHNKFGFCKFGDKCQFRHINDLCLIKNCNVGACENRHPKFCYYQKIMEGVSLRRSANIVMKKKNMYAKIKKISVILGRGWKKKSCKLLIQRTN